jgi:hypothetical protein
VDQSTASAKQVNPKNAIKLSTAPWVSNGADYPATAPFSKLKQHLNTLATNRRLCSAVKIDMLTGNDLRTKVRNLG